MISLRDVSFVLPDGRLLLDRLNESFGGGAGEGGERAALVGRNGVGKTILARIMAGLLSPSSGKIIREGIVFYLDQMLNPAHFDRVADLIGASTALDAVRKAEKGEATEKDLERAEGHWDLEERAFREFSLAGLPHLTLDTPAPTLSGGECTRAALVGAFLSEADFLILDEPTNHLDAPSRAALTEYLNTWKKDLLVVSHDRALLEEMERIVELSPPPGGLKSYGGNYSLYRELKAQERAAALDRLNHAKAERKQVASQLRLVADRQRKRAAAGNRLRDFHDTPRALLHAMRNTAEKTTGKLNRLKTDKTKALAEAEKEAFLKAGIEDAVVLIPPACSVPDGKVVLRMEGVVLPYGAHRAPIDRTIRGPLRLAVEGANGSGKTTLLRILTNEISPLQGTCEVKVPWAMLNQFADGQEERSSLELLRAGGAGKNLDEGEAGARLAQVGVAGERMKMPAGLLSGGERLKVALLCALHGDPPPQLLILDEPTNHLDADSVESVEKLLNAWTGALIAVSHDSRFLERIGVTERLLLAGENREDRFR
ncbi:MAG: ATP-binding cassette domain-containing protein [Synergistaceae bacterium]|jgi:ATPase subunit of ABC transporter with duplicated ATPase domains|nr:ATP-binding cassette domain-containing protein [Synergistaceae bacterium]